MTRSMSKRRQEDADSPALSDFQRRQTERPPPALFSRSSISSVEPASPNRWEELKAQALKRINEYKCYGREYEDKLKNVLTEALRWLPEGGRDALAQDIIDVREDDNMLYDVFANLRTAIMEAAQAIKFDDHDTAIKWSSIYTAFPKTKAIAASKINSLENGITLRQELHRAFQRFLIALRPTGIPNCYEIKKWQPDEDDLGLRLLFNYQLPADATVTLRQAFGHEDKPLPSTDLLDMHWRLCEIFHASGMAEEVKLVEQRWFKLKHDLCGCSLPEDGSLNLEEVLHVAFADHIQV
ncbi:Uncharacterized protein PECH_000218 [Penicillium ucsense]|uniref:HNH nuclease domain-containing protein n=1 Tax=Penicillium ucsense TaxID=2839758 RepID=A0A8J8W900_9EURO|nr:Uncharacterized protein PECM_008545 [Penicillium ucsense]KAF7738499.1 Uncharacterized protein PECH_000218 [Penicillium ucsense]